MSTKTLISMAGIFALLIAVSPIWADSGLDIIVKPDTPSVKQLYSTLSAEWWQWALSIPIEDSDGNVLHPLEDELGDKCYVGQRGPVWFIGAQILPDPPDELTEWPTVVVKRDCTIPAGKAVFFPILNYEVSQLENPNLKSEDQMREVAETVYDYIMNASVTISDEFSSYSMWYDENGEGELAGYGGPSSPLSKFFLPEDNYLQLIAITDSSPGTKPEQFPGGSESEFVTDGIHILIAPQDAGKSLTIKFTGKLGTQRGKDKEWIPFFELDVTYDLEFVD